MIGEPPGNIEVAHPILLLDQRIDSVPIDPCVIIGLILPVCEQLSSRLEQIGIAHFHRHCLHSEDLITRTGSAHIYFSQSQELITRNHKEKRARAPPFFFRKLNLFNVKLTPNTVSLKISHLRPPPFLLLKSCIRH